MNGVLPGVSRLGDRRADPAGVVHLHEAQQVHLLAMLVHDWQQLVLDLSSHVPAHTRLASQFQRRDAVFGFGEQADCEEPDRQR